MEHLMYNRKIFVGFAALLLTAGLASAQSVVTLPDSGETTTLTGDVAEQARVTVPAGVSFDVQDISSSTPASAASVTVDNIALDTETKQLKISIQASAAAFTPPVGGATTWAPADVSWNAPSWTNATGATGTLSSAAYNEVSTCDADAATCSTTGLIFTLAAKSTVKRAGNHTLGLTWKFESIGT
jgi:hypothetical protein